ncbi:hypothetical protein KAM338_09730 [Aeromonas caviae]|jgi:fatty acid/phospholipid biosynthesis enzyme|uniref:hypothetical protein n=1 Tax=Aeromonas TaxID=642 RepID=UPI0004643A56|nr:MULTISPECIES: hypothetical protein [Aeromonas]GKQ60796.1 hypothetical protein KAM338_09730 [Aeromonas caviae]AWA06103.1 hypothetical protein C1A23_10865 [Aeromonas hydrophila subsp. hydrophila]EIS3742968.1 hypothetical protein [Aeromonas hydrophila]MBQ4676296.1 hypothetical protein [Aeromonas hydrophila]MBW3811163.1 hypothetical protein [Aeromonas hydrophila]
MKIAILLLGCSLSASLLAAVEDRDAKQAKLDAACQQAQQQLVEQGKQQRIDACIKAGGKAAKCQQEFASFGQREGNKRPDLNNLAPCQQADAYRKSYRQ